MNHMHSSPMQAAISTQNCVPSEVVPGGTENETREWAWPPDHDQAQPACFGGGQLRIPERSESDRLCSACTSLGRLNSTHWEEIKGPRFHVSVEHHHSFDALFKSAREGCHLCGLLLIALEENWRLCQQPGGEWVAKRGYESASLSGGIRLDFKRWAPIFPSTVDEVRINIVCGDLPSAMGGRLICKAMDSERSSFLEHLHYFTID